MRTFGSQAGAALLAAWLALPAACAGVVTTVCPVAPHVAARYDARGNRTLYEVSCGGTRLVWDLAGEVPVLGDDRLVCPSPAQVRELAGR